MESKRSGFQERDLSPESCVKHLDPYYTAPIDCHGTHDPVQIAKSVQIIGSTTQCMIGILSGNLLDLAI